MGGVLSAEIFQRDPSPYSGEFRRKQIKNSDWLGRQERPRIEPGTSGQPVRSQKRSATGGANISSEVQTYKKTLVYMPFK